MSVIAREALAKELAERENLSEGVVNKVLASAFDLITEKLSAGLNVRLTGVGTLRQSSLAARSYRNPRTGGVDVKGERRAIRFEASERLEKAIGR